MKVYKYLNKMCVEVVLVDDNDMWIAKRQQPAASSSAKWVEQKNVKVKMNVFHEWKQK